MAGHLNLVQPILAELAIRRGDLTASEAAKLAGRSVSRIRYVFTATAGINFRQARLRARLAAASDLLIADALSITELSCSAKVHRPYQV